MYGPLGSDVIILFFRMLHWRIPISSYDAGSVFAFGLSLALAACVFLVFVQLLSVSQSAAEVSLGQLSWSTLCSCSLFFRVPLRSQGMGRFGGGVGLVSYRV